MYSDRLEQALQENPVIAAVKDMAGLERCIESECRIVFVLFGDLVSIGEIAERLRRAQKLVFVHLDLIEGLAAREIAVDFIAKNICADGIITTKPALVRRARTLGLLTVQRFFLLDSMALSNIARQLSQEAADAIEILPGAMPKVIARVVAASRRPVIAGGLISDKEDAIGALSAGAVAVSSSSERVWFM